MDALSDYDMAICLIPQELTAYLNRGLCNYYLKNYNEVILYFSKAIEIESCNGEYYNSRAEIYFKINEDEKVCSDFERARILGYSIDNTLFNQRCK